MTTGKGRKGFSLAELLIVVAIIAVLLAIAIPNVIGYYRSLKLTELDDSARSIFVAAQNRLTALKNAGENLYGLGNAKSAPLASGGSVDVRAVAEEEKLSVLVPGGSIDPQLHDNHYVVEIDPKTGGVFAVWYWEKEDFHYTSDAYGAVKPDKSKRLDAGKMVGYYGGDKIDRLEFRQTPLPSVQVTNAEELVLKITVPGFSTATSPAIKTTVTISNSRDTLTLVRDASLLPVSTPNVYTGTIVLDTLKDASAYDNINPTTFTATPKGKPFKEWVGTTSGITPGEDIDIEVKVCVEGNYLPQYVYYEGVNSLFESVDGDTAKIAYGRHLQNLDADTSGVTAAITKAEQVRDIDFDDNTSVKGEFSWKDTYQTKTFTPINNNQLASYDGHELIIRNLHIKESGGNAGLFDGTKATLRDIRLEDATVEGGGSVGALAGSYEGAEIDNCGVYVSDGSLYGTCTVTGSGITGGLVGSLGSAANVHESFAAVKVTGDNTGGLVGEVNANVTLQNCYSGGHTDGGKYTDATVNVTGSDCVGGLVGMVNNGTTLTLEGIDYSTCSVKTSGTTLTNVGLLVGGGTGTVTNNNTAYATGAAFNTDGTEIKSGLHSESYLDADFGTNAVSDFVTHPYDTTLTGKYPYATGLAAHYGDWLPSAATPSASSLCYYDVVGGNYGVWGYIVDPAGGMPVFVNSLASGAPNSGVCATDDGYCIPVEHGGAAPAAVTVDSTPYTVNGTAIATNVAVDSSGKTYDLYKIEGLDGVSKSNYYSQISVGSTGYYFNPFFACEVFTSDPTNRDITIGTKVGAAGIDSAGNPVNTYGDFTNKVVIRTARQLANMSTQTGNGGISAARERSYVQLFDIDFDTYAQTDLAGKEVNADKWNPMELTNSGTYDGNEFVISNLYIDKTSTDVGLFGNTSGKLDNIRLKNVKVTGGGERVGALAGRFRGSTVTNCGVYVDINNLPTGFTGNAYNTFMVTGNNDRVGGLIGNINSEATLTGCFAAVKVSSTGNQIGGLVGNIATSNNNVTLVDCYSGGHTENGLYISADVTGAQQVGGLIGGVSGDDDGHTVTFFGINYSTCSVRMTSSSNRDRIGLLVGYVNRSIVQKGTAATDIAYATGIPYNSTGTPRTDEGYLTPYAANLADILAVTNGKTAVSADKYDGSLGSSYPYLSADGMTHHGDWPELQEAVFYWEQEGTEYNFYAKGYLNNQEVTLDTLCTEHHEVEAAMNANATSNDSWGYGLYGRTTAQAPTAPSGATTITNTDAEMGLKKLLSLDDPSAGVGVTLLQGGTAGTLSTTAASHTYQLDPGFAAAIEIGASSTMGGTGNPYQIRNVQQLGNIPTGSNAYKQTHDLYGGTSTYTGASSFAGTYNGQSYRILELSMTSGLFASINGGAKLDSIILYSPSGTATVNGSGAPAGGLAGSVTGTDNTEIRNCVVAGYTMSNTSQPLGGLVGEVKKDRTLETLSITNSEAVNSLTCTTNNNDYVGGLVGHVSSCEVHITNSYAGGEITNGRYGGGIVGFVNTTSQTAGIVSYTNVYSYMKISLSNGYIKYGIGPCGYSNYLANNYYNSCYYWTGGLSGTLSDSSYLGSNAGKSLDELKILALYDSTSSLVSGKADKEHTYWPTNSTYTPTGDSYPFPAVVKDHEGKYVHYGDWPNP